MKVSSNYVHGVDKSLLLRDLHGALRGTHCASLY